jgi:hypothetical protein
MQSSSSTRRRSHSTRRPKRELMRSSCVRSAELAVAVACALVAGVHAQPRAAPVTAARARPAAQLFVDAEAHGSVRDGALIGRGSERVQRLPGGGLRVERLRDYDRVQDPKTSKIVTLPKRWHASVWFELTPELRLRRSEMTLAFDRSIDRALGRVASNDDFAWLFEFDRMSIISAAHGSVLQFVTTREGRVVKRDSYDYPAGTIPIELASMAVAVELWRRRERFEFDVILPGGDVHGVEAKVTRARDVAAFARGYPVPLPALGRLRGELALVDMRLASPFKRLFFPHHFYFVYAWAHPELLLAAWGGDPDVPMLALRE